jgi:hypothetical protein
MEVPTPVWQRPSPPRGYRLSDPNIHKALQLLGNSAANCKDHDALLVSLA